MPKLKKFFLFLGILLGWAIFCWQFYIAIKSLLENRIVVYSLSCLVISFLGMLVYIGVQTYGWYFLLVGYGGNTSWKEVASGYTFSSIAKYIPGTIWGYISRSEWFLRKSQVPYRQSSAASIFELINAVTTGFFCIGLVALLDTRIEGGFWIAGALLVPLFVWSLFKRFSSYDRIQLFKRKYNNPIKQLPIKTWGLSQLIFIIQWILLGLVTWLFMSSLNDRAPDINNLFPDIARATFAFTSSWLIGFFIPFIPGGVGIRELVLSILLNQSFNLSLAQSVVIAIGLRILYSIAEFAWGLWGLFSQKKT